MGTVTTEVVRNIWHDSEGVAVDVGPDADSLGLVRVRNHDAKSVDYFGRIELTLSPDMARAVAEAMILAADDAERAS